MNVTRTKIVQQDYFLWNVSTSYTLNLEGNMPYGTKSGAKTVHLGAKKKAPESLRSSRRGGLAGANSRLFSTLSLVLMAKVVEAGSTLVHHVQEGGKPRVTTDFKVNSVHRGSHVQVVDEKHDAVVRVGLSTSLSQTVAPLRTESRDRCPSVFLIGRIQRASDGTREDSVTVLPARAGGIKNPEA